MTRRMFLGALAVAPAVAKDAAPNNLSGPAGAGLGVDVDEGKVRNASHG